MITDRENDHHSLNLIILFGLVVSVIVGIFALNICYYREIEKSLIKQTYQDLKKENDKALTCLQRIIQTRYEMLEVLSSYNVLPEESEKERWSERIKPFEREGLRVAIVDEHGIMHYGNQESQDVSARSYFQEVLKGRKSIFRLFPEDFSGQSGIILTVPVIRKGQVKGAVCMEYTSAELGKYLNDTELSRYGANLVFTKSGELVASYPGYEKEENIYDRLKTVEGGRSGYITYDYNGSKQLLYYQSAGIKDWVVVSVMETEGYESTLHGIRTMSESFITGLTAMLTCMVALIVSIFHLRKKESKRAQKDYLTGVYTRETAKKMVEQKLKGGGKKRFYACMFLDIDDFKKINDTFGHHRGDLVLTQAGQILNACTREEDVIVRFGGDEFCIWLYGISGREEAEVIAKRILNTFDASGTIHASIGITLVREEDREYDAILRRADQALYQAKRKGKNQFALQP